jgi:beta-lactam-binding protein with PASTA domain
MAEVAEGTVVDGRYRIEHRLGSGGMADVYCAADSQLGRQIALKVLHRRFARDREFVERFRREASAAAGLQHPNVVGVFDRGEYDGTYYIAMEYLPGRTLKEVIRDEAPLDQLRAIDYGIQILQAASFAHRRGVIHRDFKPHNVIVGADDRLKVTDFGIARAGASEMTETGSIMGTAQYLSPEQAQGQRVGAPSDLYSIGVVLFEMLTARVPFTGESAVSIALKHVSEEPPPLRQLRPDLHPRLEQAVGRALLKDPAQRYASADEFIAALEQARAAIVSGDNGGGTSTFVPVPPEERDPRGRRWPFVVLALVLLGIAAFAGLWQVLTPEQVTVPKVVGKSVARATVALEKDGFKVKTHGVQSDRKPGTVVSQDPPARTDVKKGSTVDLGVSSGPGQGVVPDVSNLPRKDAIQALNDAGFKVVEDPPQPSATVAKGSAIRTSPPANKVILKGTDVRLFVSSGPPQVVVPPVVGLNRAVALGKLQDAGLKVTEESATSNTTPKDQVISQDPAGNVRVDKGTRVTIVVSKGPEKVQVPDVVGQLKADATATLKGVGFKVKAVDQESATQPPGTVLRQSPPAGSKAVKGSVVTIYVAKAPPSSGGTGPGGTTTTPPATTPNPGGTN